LHLRHEVDRVLRPAVHLGVAALAAEALDLRHGESVDAELLDCRLHVIQLERLDDPYDELHAYSFCPPLFPRSPLPAPVITTQVHQRRVRGPSRDCYTPTGGEPSPGPSSPARARRILAFPRPQASSAPPSSSSPNSTGECNTMP